MMHIEANMCTIWTPDKIFVRTEMHIWWCMCTEKYMCMNVQDEMNFGINLHVCIIFSNSNNIETKSDNILSVFDRNAGITLFLLHRHSGWRLRLGFFWSRYVVGSCLQLRRINVVKIHFFASWLAHRHRNGIYIYSLWKASLLWLGWGG